MTYEELKTWGYRLNQILRWQASQEEMEAQAVAWGFTDSDAQAMAEVATALQADENIFR